MKTLDFFSSSPNFSIFETEVNKTNFGGVFFLIYLIIMFFISLAYILDYSLNEKYIVQSNSVAFVGKNHLNNILSSEVNPNLIEMDTEIILKFRADIDEESAKRFYVGFSLKTYSLEIFRGNKTSSDQISFYLNIPIKDIFHVTIGYDCIYVNCPDFDEYKGMWITFNSKKFHIDNNANIPVQFYGYYYESEGNPEFHAGDENDIIMSSDESNHECSFTWIPVIYQEKKGISRLFNKLFNISNIYTTGFITNVDYHLEDEIVGVYNLESGNEEEFEGEEIYENEIINKFQNENEYENGDENEDGLKDREIARIIGQFGDYYILYQRSKIEFTDVLATIGALFSTINFIFSTVYKYYSKNFDKYKIIEKILQTSQLNKKAIPLNQNINNLNQIELTNVNIIKPDLNNKLEETNNENKNNQNDKNNLLSPLINNDDLKEEIDKSFPNNDNDK